MLDHEDVGLSENSVPTPNGFADHDPVFKWLFHWWYTPFSDIPIYWITYHNLSYFQTYHLLLSNMLIFIQICWIMRMWM